MTTFTEPHSEVQAIGHARNYDSFTLTINVTVFVSGTFDYRAALNPFLTVQTMVTLTVRVNPLLLPKQRNVISNRQCCN